MATRKSLKNLEFKILNGWEDFARDNPHARFIPEIAKDLDGDVYIRKRGTEVVYLLKEISEDGMMHLSCLGCGGYLAQSIIRNKIYLDKSISPYEFVLYCPQCEQDPSKNFPILKKYQKKH